MYILNLHLPLSRLSWNPLTPAPPPQTCLESPLCHEDTSNVVQPCISIKTLIINDLFQCYETEPPNQLRDKIDQFESCGIKPLQDINSSFFNFMLMRKHGILISCAIQNILMCETHSNFHYCDSIFDKL